MFYREISDESNIHNCKDEDKETLIDKQKRPMPLSVQKAMERIKEQSE